MSTGKQTAIPLPRQRQPIEWGKCAWCGEQAVAEIEVEPAVRGFAVHPGTGVKRKVIRKKAITAKVCKKHQGSLKLATDDDPGYYTVKGGK